MIPSMALLFGIGRSGVYGGVASIMLLACSLLGPISAKVSRLFSKTRLFL